MVPGKVLVIDDDRSVRKSLRRLFEFNRMVVIEADSAAAALDIVKRELPSVILLDLKMPDVNGLDLLLQLLTIASQIPVIVLSGHGDIPTAVKATKIGAFDFIEKTADNEHLLRTVRRALEITELAMEKKKLQGEVVRLNSAVDMSLEWMLGRSEPMRLVIEQIHQVAWTNFSVILQGETGSGKSLIAHLIHNLSKGVNCPFVRVDVGALPETLIESELFGYEKGAFTGATQKKKGYFETASGGTLFIDELENIPDRIQSKLLGVLEQKAVYPVGSAVSVPIDVRIIAATNKDLKQCVQQKAFREDLYFRLNEFFIHIPPLRDRIDDIAFFAHRFLNEVAEEMKRPVKRISEEVLALFSQYAWPGNIRELKNVIRRAALLAQNGTIQAEHVGFLHGSAGGSLLSPVMSLKEVSAMAVRNAESKAIRNALMQTGGNKTKAAVLLKIDYSTLLAKIKAYQIA